MPSTNFDPDAFLAQQEKPSGEFDPDAFLAQHENNSHTYKDPDGSPINPPGTGLLSGLYRDYQAYGQKPIIAGIKSMEDGNGFLAGAKKQFGQNPDTGPNVSDITAKIPDRYNVNFQPALDVLSKASPMARYGMDVRKAFGQKNDVQGFLDQAAGMTTDPITLAGAGGMIGSKAAGFIGKAEPAIEAASGGPSIPTGGGGEPVPIVSENQAPRSIKELNAIVDKAHSEGAFTPPKLNTINKALEAVPDMKHPLVPAQIRALSDPAEWKLYRTMVDDPTDTHGQVYSKYEQLQKNDLKDKLDEALLSHAKRDPISDPVDAGSNAIGTIIKKTDASDAQLAPIFDKIRSQPAVPGQYAEDLVSRIKKKLPGLEFNESEKPIPGLESDPDAGQATQYSMAPYSARKTGMTQGQYNMIKNHFEDLANSSYTPSDVQNIRRAVRNSIDPNSSSSGDLKRFNSALLDHMEHVAANENPELSGQIRSTFNEYRQNRQNMEDLGKTVAFRNIEDPEKLAKDFPPETALPRMFKDSATVGKMKNLLGEDFSGVTSDYLTSLKNNATDANGNFSSAKFTSSLRKSAPALQKAFEDSPEMLKRIQGITDVMRIIPDAAPVNPSGTANASNIMSKMHTIKKGWGLLSRPHEEIPKMLGEKAMEVIKDRNAANTAAGFLKKKD
jgi:hypothetical protein